MGNKYIRYVILVNKLKDYNSEVINRHVEYLTLLEKSGRLVICGPFTDYKGGIVIIKADSMTAAKAIAESDPFVSEGFSSFEIRTMEISSKENNHLGFG